MPRHRGRPSDTRCSFGLRVKRCRGARHPPRSGVPWGKVAVRRPLRVPAPPTVPRPAPLPVPEALRPPSCRVRRPCRWPGAAMTRRWSSGRRSSPRAPMPADSSLPPSKVHDAGVVLVDGHRDAHPVVFLAIEVDVGLVPARDLLHIVSGFGVGHRLYEVVHSDLIAEGR